MTVRVGTGRDGGAYRAADPAEVVELLGRIATLSPSPTLTPVARIARCPDRPASSRPVCVYSTPPYGSRRLGDTDCP